jgi:hypothetical protein
MSKVTKDIILSYSTCTDSAVLNRFQNILDSFWHKDEGLVFAKSVKDIEAGTNTLSFRKADGTLQNVVIDIPAAPVASKPISYIDELQTELNKLVQKVDGKGLSTNDLTTELLEKLNGLQNYVHPDQHQTADVEGLNDLIVQMQENISTITDAVPIDRISRTIYIQPADLSGTGDLRDQVAEYINASGIIKESTTADFWVEVLPSP